MPRANPRAAAEAIARRGLFMLVVALLAILTCVGPVAASVGNARSAMRPAAVPGRLLVGVRPTMHTSQVGTLQTLTGAQVKKRLLGGQILVLDVPDGVSTQQVQMRALSHPDVLFVEPDRMMYPALVPDDPEYSEQWHHPIIRSPEAWDVQQGSKDVIIAIVDTGVDLDHPDLEGKIWTNPGEVPGNGIDDDGNGFIDDVHGWDFQNDTNDPNPEPDGVDDDNNGTVDDQVCHGTLVAGLAAAIGNEGWGTAGVDWRARVMPVQTFPDDGGSQVSTVIEGIEYAIAMGADVINLSIGGDYSQSFTPAIRSAYEAGIVVVAAAGNTGKEFTDSKTVWESPVCNDGGLGVDNWVLGVGSTDRNDLRASFSNYDGSTAGTFVDCVAPGEGMYGPGYYDPGFSHLSSYYTTNTGTSFSVPLVSGLAALVLAQNPGMSPDDVLAQIRSSCDDIDALNPGFAGKLGGGRINCARAVGVELAPRPPGDLTASDTPDDQGGSITLTWQLSPDDGAGGDTVTAYIILRREGASGSFAEIDRVSAGTSEYADTDVTDGDEYYYLVRVTDGAQTSDSDVAGPVQSRNDLPPPAVTGVYAEDRPADDGGAIRVGWDTYTPPADFAHFAIYRAGVIIRDVTARDPIAEVTDAAATQYVDTTTSDGVDYYYAVTAIDTFGNEVTDVTAAGPVQSFANGETTLPAGLHLFGSPLEPADGEPATFFGVAPAELKMARWSAAAGDYAVYSGTGSLPLRLGRGYWLQLDEPLSFVPAGNPAESGSMQVSLTPGWHQLANPYFGDMDIAAATVQYQGTTMDLASADAANVMRQVLWTYDREDGGYALTAPFLGIGESEIEPWEGFWVSAAKSCTLTLPRPSGVMTPTAEMGAAGDGEWRARLCACSGGGEDLDNFFGISAALADVGSLPSPPMTPGGVDLAFAREGAGVRSAARFSAVAPSQAQWRVVLDAAAGSRVELWCATPDAIPREYDVALVDTAAGATYDLRGGARHVIELRSDESRRVLSLRLTRVGGALTLTSLMVEPTDAGGAQIAFALSAAADCTVSVLNIAGRTVRLLERGRSRPAGVSQAVWDGRSTTGSAVPNGAYLVLVEAASSDGSRTKAVRTLAIRR